ncbi:hypothetical protein GCM10018773_09490 [Streptomyces candidus]|nr:hypothetical protein GCM10018773_09490 [Streptomyces candidus]
MFTLRSQAASQPLPRPPLRTETAVIVRRKPYGSTPATTTGISQATFGVHDGATSTSSVRRDPHRSLTTQYAGETHPKPLVLFSTSERAGARRGPNGRHLVRVAEWQTR